MSNSLLKRSNSSSHLEGKAHKKLQSEEAEELIKEQAGLSFSKKASRNVLNNPVTQLSGAPVMEEDMKVELNIKEVAPFDSFSHSSSNNSVDHTYNPYSFKRLE